MRLIRNFLALIGILAVLALASAFAMMLNGPSSPEAFKQHAVQYFSQQASQTYDIGGN